MAQKPDYGLVVLTVAVFIVSLYAGASLGWASLAALVASLLYLGLRFPEGRRSWGVAPREGVYIVATAVSTVVLAALLFAAASAIPFPEAGTMLLLTLVIVMGILLIAGLASPSGMDRRL